ncbi:MAG TPA: ribonuclease HII [Candidatus Nanoarchaeia archaeon]|nr:ribonuclease HII [Candidatus Nanoarchaeia archaeon]
METVLGIDDAGRGPVIGPLIIAGVLIDRDDEEKLKDMGVKDSKLLSPFARTVLYGKIVKIAKGYKAIVISPKKVDEYVAENALNWLEADAAIELIQELKPDIAIIDCPSNNIKSFSDYLGKKVDVGIRAEHKADVLFPVVSAASIIAKVTRDMEIEKIKKEYNIDFGSGYPADPRTVQFLEKNFRNPKYGPIIRKSWAPFKKLKAGQSKLGEF